MPPASAAPWSDLGPAVDTLWFLLGAALVVAALRLWVGRDLPLGVAAAALATTLAVHGAALFTPALGIPAGIEYAVEPWASDGAELASASTNALLTDVDQLFLPLRTLVQGRLLHRQLPFWSHELGVGQPLLGNAQSAALSPFQIFCLALPAARAITLVAALALLLALLGTYLLARELGADIGGALFAAAAFSLSTFFVAWSLYPLGLAAAHLPALGLALLRATRPAAERDRRAPAAAAIVLASMLLAGNPEPVALAAIPALVLVALRLARLPRREYLPALARLIVAAALGLALSAPAWIPLLSTASESARVAELALDPRHMSPPLSRAALTTLVEPLAAGSPVDGSWVGHGQDNWSELASGYAGLTALTLALASWLVPAARTRALGAAAVAILLLALRLPWLDSVVPGVPGLALVPAARLRLFWVLAVALSAGLALSRLERQAPALRRAIVAAAGGALVLYAVAAGALAFSSPRFLAVALGLALVAATALAARARAVALVAIAAVALDLVPLAWKFHPTVPPTMDFRPPAAVSFLVDRATSFPAPLRVAALEGRLLPYLPALYGLWDPRGYDALRPWAPRAILRARFGESDPTGTLLLPRAAADSAGSTLDRLAVRFLLTGPSIELPAPWVRIEQERRLAIWENPGALQLFFAPLRTSPATSRAAALQLASWALVPDEDVALERRYEPQVSPPPEVRAIAALNNGFSLEVVAPQGGVIASSVAWMPGWHADGAELLRVDGAYLGLHLAPGAGHVELRYSPPGWSIAIWLLVAGLAGLALSIFRAVSPALSSRRS